MSASLSLSKTFELIARGESVSAYSKGRGNEHDLARQELAVFLKAWADRKDEMADVSKLYTRDPVTRRITVNNEALDAALKYFQSINESPQRGRLLKQDGIVGSETKFALKINLEHISQARQTSCDPMALPIFRGTKTDCPKLEEFMRQVAHAESTNYPLSSGDREILGYLTPLLGKRTLMGSPPGKRT